MRGGVRVERVTVDAGARVDAGPAIPASPPRGPFEGLRVLDFGTFVAGTFGATLMGDLGAEVIKVESLEGDPARFVPPFYRGESRFYVGLNRNKRSLAIDLTNDAGLALVHELVRRTDIVVDNFRFGAAEKLGLDYETLAALNPRLIHCSATGFGTRGPLARHPAFDGALQAMAGIAQANVRTCGKATHGAVLVVDFSTALLSLGAIATALYHRERTGVGQKVELSLMQSAMTVMTTAYCQALELEPHGLVGGYPYRLFETAEGSLFVGVAQNKFWPLLCLALDRVDLAENPRYQNHAERGLLAAELDAILEPIFRERSAAEWERRLIVAGVPCGPVLSVDQFFDHPQVDAMDMGPVVTHSALGPLRVAGMPMQFQATPGAIQRAAPCLGEHTLEILAELEVDAGRIEELRERGIIGATPGSAT